MTPRPIQELAESLGHCFANIALLERAVTHSSFAREGGECGDNEQLEFLGDAVLQLAASQELYRRFPNDGEGQLSKMRAHLVNANHLLHCAERLKLGDYVRLGRGEEKTGGRRKTAVLADAVEAILAALYLDGGLFVARQFVLTHILEPELARLAESKDVVLVADHKSRLQELLQSHGLSEPKYELISQEGPPHCRIFTIEVRLTDPASGELLTFAASGDSKKSAGRAAAERALEHLQSCPHE